MRGEYPRPEFRRDVYKRQAQSHPAKGFGGVNAQGLAAVHHAVAGLVEHIVIHKKTPRFVNSA